MGPSPPCTARTPKLRKSPRWSVVIPATPYSPWKQAVLPLPQEKITNWYKTTSLSNFRCPFGTTEFAAPHLITPRRRRTGRLRAVIASALRRCPSGKGSALWLSRSARFTRFAARLQTGLHRAGLHTPEGQPLSYEVFAGNRTDVTTVEKMVRTMEEKYGQAQRVWVMDRGMVSEKNSGFLRERGARHLVGTPNRLGPRHGPLTELLPSIYFAHRCPPSILQDNSCPCASSR